MKTGGHVAVLATVPHRIDRAATIRHVSGVEIYRIIRLSPDMRIEGVEKYALPTDRAAMDIGLRMAAEHSIEVWKAETRIAYFARGARPPFP